MRKELSEFAREYFDQWEVEHRVGLTAVGPYHVSTVLLYVDFGPPTRGRSMVYETMVYQDDPQNLFSRTSWEDFEERYHTKEEALAGHEKAVALYTEKLNEELRGK